MRLKKKHYLFIIAALVLLLFPIYYYVVYKRSKSSSTIVIGQVTLRNINQYLSSSGNIEPWSITSLSVPSSESISSVAVFPGSAVTKGQLLLKSNFKEYRSPLNGYLLKGPATPGDPSFKDDARILVLSTLDSLVFTGTVAEYEVLQLVPGQRADIIPGIAWKDTLQGIVRSVEAAGSSKNGNTQYRISAVISNGSHHLTKTGFTATARINTASRNNVPAVKEEFIFEDGADRYVYVMTNGSKDKYNKKIITTGLSDGIYTEITAGVSAGETICLPR
jgi:multidrug efflux pump subunit AcrA (membrane-fusion protein)